MMEYVDAIHEGRIVRVGRETAMREGLVILRKIEEKPQVKEARRNKEEQFVGFDDFRKPLAGRKSQVFNELKDNFHWDLVKSRKARNLSRKQVASSIACTENDLKMMENGVLPSNDFVLVNKLQSYYSINLRRDGKDFVGLARNKVEKMKDWENKTRENKGKGDGLVGSGIELF